MSNSHPLLAATLLPPPMDDSQGSSSPGSASVAACVGVAVNVGVVCCYVYFWPVVMLFFDCFVHGPQSRLCRAAAGAQQRGGGGGREATSLCAALCLLFSV